MTRRILSPRYNRVPDWKQAQDQAERERQVRDMKDLAGVAYMGKNE